MFDVFKVGHVVKNPELWKKLQLSVSALAPLVPFVAIFSPQLAVFITLQNIAAVTALLGVINAIITIISTDKIGI